MVSFSRTNVPSHHSMHVRQCCLEVGPTDRHLERRNIAATATLAVAVPLPRFSIERKTLSFATMDGAGASEFAPRKLCAFQPCRAVRLDFLLSKRVKSRRIEAFNHMERSLRKGRVPDVFVVFCPALQTSSLDLDLTESWSRCPNRLSSCKIGA